MLIAKITVCGLALALCTSPALSQISNLLGCPITTDLQDGIIFTDPARHGALERRYQHLKGPYFGVNYVNGIIQDGITISYSGLFTFKHGVKGKVVQYEEPQSDLTDLLKFKAASTQIFESIRVKPQALDLKWVISAQYRIQKAQDFSIGRCTYAAVQFSRQGTLTFPDGTLKQDRQNYTFVPELLLRVSGTGVMWGDISNVRTRTIFDAQTWPFSKGTADVLKD